MWATPVAGPHSVAPLALDDVHRRLLEVLEDLLALVRGEVGVAAVDADLREDGDLGVAVLAQDGRFDVLHGDVESVREDVAEPGRVQAAAEADDLLARARRSRRGGG